MKLFLQGAVAGYGIAIPVGAVAVLIMQTASRRGFLIGAFAGVGAASADLVYALVAVSFGAAAAEALEPVGGALKVVAAIILLAVAARGLWAVRARGVPKPTSSSPPLATYALFLGITILNPATIAYFAALVLGLDLGDSSWASKALFVAGAFLASASWQLTIAGVGVALHHALADKARVVTGIAGSLIIAGLAVYTLLS
ncbi:MAG TPA: LysE family transporter [Actinomycetota bacterium]|nr:LysE family transporter [Actinomycetota bacterium]